MTRCLRLIRRFAEDCRGTALIDLAFAVPVLVVVLLGCFEATRYVLLHQKLDRAASATADLVSQQSALTTAQLNDLFDAASQLMEPYDLGASGRLFVSSVYRPGAAAATVAWQRQTATGINVVSAVGVEDATAALPPGFTLDVGDNVIVAEVYYDYTPFFLNTVFDALQLYHNAYNRPRERSLTQITPP